jgi:tripartite-type tricarboxylate transporter receptor subunit TctC
VGSFVGGILSVVGLTLLAPPLASLAVSFGPPEYVALTVLGILLVTYLTVLTGLLGGNTTAGSVNLSQDMLPSIEPGALRVLAVGTDQRLSYLDAPTFLEQGYPEITQSTTTFGVIAPTGTPAPVIARLEETMRAASADAGVRRGLDERYVPGQFMGSAELAALFAETEQTIRGVVGG